jgi:hypothetical protein
VGIDFNDIMFDRDGSYTVKFGGVSVASNLHSTQTLEGNGGGPNGVGLNYTVQVQSAKQCAPRVVYRRWCLARVRQVHRL